MRPGSYSLGSVVAITNGAGSVVARYRYGAYGEVLLATGSDAALAARNPIRYRSYYYDAETGLYYLPARYYDPDTMRFLSADPASPSAGDPLSLNRYAYCVGDPVDGDDPTGAVMVAGGGGGFDPEDVDSGDVAWVFAAKGVGTGYAYAAANRLRSLPSHQAWRQARESAPAARQASDFRMESEWLRSAGSRSLTGSASWGLSQPDSTTLWLDGLCAGCDVVWVGGISLAGASAGACATPALLSGVPVAGLGAGGAIAVGASGVSQAVDWLGLTWSGLQVARGHGRMGDVALSMLEVAWVYPGSGTVKFWIINPYLTLHGEPSPQ